VKVMDIQSTCNDNIQHKERQDTNTIVHSEIQTQAHMKNLGH
jgi:hypothetical protein